MMPVAHDPPLDDRNVGVLPDRERAPASNIRFTSNIAGPILVLADIICLLVSIPLSLAAYRLVTDQPLMASVHLFAFCAMAASYLLFRSSRRSYRQSLISPIDHGDSVIDALASVLIASALVWQFGMIENLSRGMTLLFSFAIVATLLGSRPIARAGLRELARRCLIEQRVVFYGADPASLAIIRCAIDTADLPHVRFVGVADDRPKGIWSSDLEFVGGIPALIEMAQKGELDQVLLCSPGLPKQRVLDIVEQLSAVSVDVAFVPPMAVELAPDYEVNLLGRIPVLTLWQRPFRDTNGIAKRAADLAISSLAIAMLSPIMLIAAVLVKLSGPGPVLFVQPRIGFNNEVIRVKKFRTMHTHQVDVGGRATTTRNDPRVTAVGRWLRKSSIDELPQLFNVWRGDMSLVGPRPHAIHMMIGDRHYQETVRGYASRHRVKPGITGLAQVKGLRGEIRTVERAQRRVELDKEYIENWSLWFDLWILVLTVRAVVWDSDAY